MCGIAGYIGTRRLSDARAQNCLRLMNRRGPDASGTYRYTTNNGRQVLLLHSRLKIIDFDQRANQPFVCGEAVLAFNGELYNYLEVRERLRGAGCKFATESDTEVLAQTLRVGGEKSLDACEGMWAFAYFNEPSESLLLSRDRFGEKPLFLHRASDGIYFGSEPKFIFELLGRRLEPNLTQVMRYLVNGYKSLYKGRDTFFDGLAELEPGSCLRINEDGEETCFRYWHPRFAQDDSISYQDAVAGVRQRVIDSVRLRLRADVPIAFCMSGGIDSNSLISVAKRVFDYDVHGFTVVNEDSRYEEQEQVAHAVEQLRIKHTPIPITADGFLDNLALLIAHHDTPVYTISYYVHWLLMSRVAEAGYRISVSGTAADELLTGYFDHHNLYLYEVRNTENFDSAVAGWNRRVRPYVRNPYLQQADLYLKDPTVRDHVFLNNHQFAEYLCRDWCEEFSESSYSDSLLRNRMLNEMFHEAVPVILHEDDSNAMYYSIENRSPFLDRGLFEFCYRIPSRHLIRDGYAKVVLRDAMQGIVPEKILWNERKVGFNAPIFSFLDVTSPTVRERLLEPSPIFDIVNRDSVEQLLGKPDLPNSESKFLFYFLNSKLFLEQLAT